MMLALAGLRHGTLHHLEEVSLIAFGGRKEGSEIVVVREELWRVACVGPIEPVHGLANSLLGCNLYADAPFGGCRQLLLCGFIEGIGHRNNKVAPCILAKGNGADPPAEVRGQEEQGPKLHGLEVPCRAPRNVSDARDEVIENVLGEGCHAAQVFEESLAQGGLCPENAAEVCKAEELSQDAVFRAEVHDAMVQADEPCAQVFCAMTG